MIKLSKNKIVTGIAVLIALLLTFGNIPSISNVNNAALITQASTTVINPGNTLSLSCNTTLHIIPRDAHTVDVLCEGTIVATSVPTNTPINTATPTKTSTTVPTATRTPTNVPNSTPTNTPVANTSCIRPYTADSPWNTKLSNPVYHLDSTQHVAELSGTFGSDPTQYTMPLYIVNSNTPIRKVTLSGNLSNVSNDSTITRGSSINVPIPDGVKPAAGSDAQIIFWNQSTGDEWGFNGVVVNSDGSLNVKNGYHYNTNWDGVAPSGFGSRGAGVPYLTGLIRPCEIAQGHIDHAIAFAYDTPSSLFVYPATKSDGSGSTNMPEGARLQLDPTLTDTQIQAWGCKNSCLIIAHALQQYGMIIIDKAGHPKIYAEYEGTAHWNGIISANTPSTIPLNKFKLLDY